MKKYQTQARKTETVIEDNLTLEKAKLRIEYYETCDKINGYFAPNSYEFVEMQNNMKNIHLIPTTNPSRLYLIKSNNFLGITSNNPMVTKNFGGATQNQHIYITNNEEIKGIDYYYDLTHNRVMKGVFYSSSDKNCRKIILTDNKDLINDGVQAIDDEFLEWFVNNPSCEEVDIDLFPKNSNKLYKIIILQKEPIPCSFCETPKELPTYNRVSFLNKGGRLAGAIFSGTVVKNGKVEETEKIVYTENTITKKDVVSKLEEMCKYEGCTYIRYSLYANRLEASDDGVNYFDLDEDIVSSILDK